MTDKLLPNRVIVDRTVLVKLLALYANVEEEYCFDEEAARIRQLAAEVESGERVELYAADWPGSD